MQPANLIPDVIEKINPPQSAFACPSAELLLPCECSPHSNEPEKAKLSCAGKNLDDSTISRILDAYLNAESTSLPLGFLELKENRLNQVPDQLPFFNQLKFIDLSKNNIQSVKPGALIRPGVHNN